MRCQKARTDSVGAVVLGAAGEPSAARADASRARYAVIIGDDEVAAQQVTLKPLRGTAEQTRVEVTLAIEYLKQASI